MVSGILAVMGRSISHGCMRGARCFFPPERALEPKDDAEDGMEAADERAEDDEAAEEADKEAPSSEVPAIWARMT